MKGWRAGDGLGLATLVWCLAWSGDLVAAWRHAPYDRFGWVAALAWLALVAVLGARTKARENRWLVVAWIFSFLGIAGNLNVARHAALALAGAAWVGGGWMRGLAVMVAAASWMPALGWGARGLGAEAVNGLRLAGAVACGLAIWFQERRTWQK